MELFSGVQIAPNFLHQHPFGFPAYVLDRKVQGGFKAAKWASRSRLGIYLGSSDHYANNVGLILSLTSGLVSPQFHVQFDDECISAAQQFGNTVPTSKWQHKSGFIGGSERSTKVDLNQLSLVDQLPVMKDQLAQVDTHHDDNMPLPEGVDDLPSEEVPEPLNPPVVQLHQPSIEEVVQTTRSGRLVGPPVHLKD
jgi:hypothetical protein